MDSLKGRDASAIAITGLSCRLPGDCESPQLFSESICSGKSAWSEVPASRWKAGGFWSATKKRNTAISKSGHFIKQDVSSFDASFFGISSAEAAAMDPQHRLMTEVAYEAAESAGFWLWDLRGPSLTLDTACSSSLVALHLACESLRSGESDMAIVGGCNLMLGPEVFIFFGGQGFLSPDGKSKAFDVSADGYGRGEGFAAVVLRRAQDAISNGDPIRAVIRGTACNQDGHTKGFTQPSSEAQASLITQVYAQAKLGFEATGYVEAHGTGTQTGDLQETMAISQTLSSCRSAANKLLIGSVKTNIGHLEAAAGLAAVIKSVLILEHGMIPANIHFKTPNPKIPFDDWNIKVPTALVPFPSSKAANGVRRISVNSFGYGGTNAHAIIDDAASYLKSLGVDGGLHFTKVARGSQPALENDSSLARESGKLSYRLYPITSQSRDGLKRTKKALATYLGSKSITSMTENEQASFLRDLSFTLSKRRSLLQWKTYAVASPSSTDDLAKIGPHSALRGPSLQSLQAIGVTNVPYFSALTRNEDAVQTALGLAGTLFSHGVPLDFAAVNQDKSFKRPPRTLVHLPPYQWNHSQKYWAESRLAREFRLRDNGARSLIGAPLPATSARERIWRGFLRLEEQPWVGHHKINDSILYPAAGFIAMVVEGLRQLLFYDTTQKHRTLSGFRLRDVQLVSPMLVSSEMSEVEYILSLQPEQEEGSYRFAVASCGDGQSLSNNCTGTAMVEYEGAEPVLSAEQAESTSAFKAAASSCKHAVDPARFYETLRQAGFDYGPCFSNVVSLSCKPNTSVGTVVVPDVGFTPADTNSMPEELYKNRPHIVHPTFLDAVLHLCFAALMGDGNKMTRPMVPTHFDEIHLSTKLPIHVGKHLRGFSHARMAGLKTLLADVAIMDEQESMPVLTIRGLSCSEIDSATSRAVGTGLPNTKRYVSQMVWRPHLQLLSGQHLNSWMQSKAKTVHEVLAVYIKLLHHIRPSVTLLEFTPASEASQTLLSSLVKLGIAPLLNTAKYTVCTTGTPALDNIKEFLQSISDIPEESLQAIELDLLSGKPQDDAVEPAAPLLADMVIATDLLAKGIEQAKELVQKLAGHLSNEGKLLVVQKDAGHVSDLKEIAHQAGLFVEAELRATEGVLIVLKAMYAVNGHQNINGIKPIPEMPVTLLACPSASQAAKGFFQELCQFLSSAGFAPSIVSWDPAQLESLKDKVVLSLLEIERPFWRDLAAAPEGTSEDNFLAARDLMTLAQSVTWVTGFADPAAEMVTGIARVVRNETPGLSFRTIHIYDSLDSRAAELLSKAFSLRGSTQPDDAEFRIDQGVVQVNRVSVDLDADNMMKDLVSADKGGTTRPLDKVELGSLAKDSCLRLAVEAAGGLDSLQFVEEQAMAEDEVEIVVKASCLSETDLATVKGQNRLDPNLLGTGASGVVSRIDSKSNPGKLKVGDRVMVLTPGAHRTFLRTKASHVGKIPASLSFKDAACIPLAFTMAWYALVYLGRLTSLEKGKTCLIHDALSTVGRQAVYIARLLGLQISVTVDSPSQANYAAGVLGVDLSHTVLLSSTTVFDLSRVVRELTPDRRGVDLVIDCSGTLTGEALRQTMGALAPFAHFIRCPTSDGSPASAAAAASAGAAFGATASSTNVNRTMSSVDIALLLRSQPDALAPMIQQAFQFFYENGCHVSGGVESFPVSSVAAAFRRVEAGSVESITLTYSDEDVVPARLRPQLLDHSAGPSRGVALDPNSIYVLSGGLGGLGRSLSTFMVEKLGARKILFLSRSGAASSSARQLLADLEASKTRPAVAAYPCDVSDREALAQSLSKAEAEMGGKIKGVIQCAMVLRDVLWSHMSYKQWVESTLPKVQGTENLSTLLPDVDFFISLSSFAGVFGNRGQANYAAGNCYQDALARHRRQVLGLKSGLTIDVPSMQGIGVLAETGMLESLREWDEVYGMDEAEFHHVMGLAIRRDMTKEGTLEAKQQLILGIATGGSAHAAGIQIPYYLESEAKFSIMEKTDMVFLGGAPNSQSASTDQPKDKSIKDILVKAADMDEASDAITKALIARVAGMQRVAVGEVDASRYLHSYGVDSLAAIDIANWALKEVGSKISVFDVMAAMPITALAEKCAARSNFVPRELKELGAPVVANPTHLSLGEKAPPLTVMVTTENRPGLAPDSRAEKAPVPGVTGTWTTVATSAETTA
ncbi:hypothetical protein PoMZ_09234 [Pyricularia oryzae]|uniref:Uncharacterized protein n=1 Tax=Pyricularia oryzae TaxID=318829 RepID=A0A4P7MTG9_PYROR|nr:hypothetical protein PoMZ_09234 [Pyricularia oryzae]